MPTQALTCASCGATINVPPDIDRLHCAHCGTALNVVRGDGYIASKLADAVTRSITISGAATQSELIRVQLRQEATALEMQLANLEAEGRALHRTPVSPYQRQQLAHLEGRYDHLVLRLMKIQDELHTPYTHRMFHPPVPPEIAARHAAEQAAASRAARTVKWVIIGIVAVAIFLCIMLMVANNG